MRGNHTNNYAEGGIRIIKEMEFITITVEQYFCNRLLDLAHSIYRPGIAIKYKDLSLAQNNYLNTYLSVVCRMHNRVFV